MASIPILRDLSAYNISEEQTVTLDFEGGIKISGEIITGKRNLKGKIILISIKNCSVTYKNELLFKPDWGIYDMAIGKEIVSAFSGAADINSFDLITHVPSETTIQVKKTEKLIELETLYKQVRNYREKKYDTFSKTKILETLIKQHSLDWLLPVELYELAFLNNDKKICETIFQHLETIKLKKPELSKLINDGIEIIHSKRF